MKRCFITQQVPPHLVVKFNISQAGVNFCNHLVENGMFNQAFALPIMSIIPDIKNECAKDPNYKYIQTRIFPHRKVGKALNAILENVKCAFAVLKYENIWFYNLNKHTLLAFIILRYFFFKRVYVLVADFRPAPKFSVNGLMKYFIDNCKGIITLSDRSVFRNGNSLCLPGIVPAAKISLQSPPLEERCFLLSGVLKKATGIEMAIDVFSRLPNETLYITGMLENQYVEKVKLCDNIKYYGYLDYKDYKTLISKICFGLSFRDPSQQINQNNFPSKILEYFSLSKIVISTIEYPEIIGLKYFTCQYDADDIVGVIERVTKMSTSELLEYTRHAPYLQEKLSVNAWSHAFTQVETI